MTYELDDDEDFEIPERTDKEIAREIAKLQKQRTSKKLNDFQRGSIDGKLAVLQGKVEDSELNELWDRNWYNRHIGNYWEDSGGNRGKCAQDFHNGRLSTCETCKKVVNRYGQGNLITPTYYDAGVLHGKLCANNWRSGMDWERSGDT